jgi:hypothetical protein
MNSYAVANGFSWNLIVWTFVFGGISVFFISSRISFKLAAVLITIKFLIVATYFGIWSDGTWFIGGDDQGYFETGLILLQTGYSPLDIWFSPEGKYLLSAHTSVALYRWWNMLWLYLIEPSYFAPVMANAFVSVLSACLFDSILRISGYARRFRAGFLAFFLLHWDIVAWTSFLNIKEALIVFLLLLLIRSVLQIGNRQYIVINLSLIAMCVILFQGIRFYYPILIGVAVSLYWLSKTPRPVITVGALLVVGVGLAWFYGNYLDLVQELVKVNQVGRGIGRMLFSPLPWKISDPATYLIPGSILHIALLPGAVFGAWQLLKSSSQTRLIVLVVIVGLAFYALVPRLGSPRHRAPMMALWTLFEYQFIFVLIMGWVRARATSALSGLSPKIGQGIS